VAIQNVCKKAQGEKQRDLVLSEMASKGYYLVAVSERGFVTQGSMASVIEYSLYFVRDDRRRYT
jgi:hypothetical protein